MTNTVRAIVVVLLLAGGVLAQDGGVVGQPAPRSLQFAHTVSFQGGKIVNTDYDAVKTAALQQWIAARYTYGRGGYFDDATVRDRFWAVNPKFRPYYYGLFGLYLADATTIQQWGVATGQDPAAVDSIFLRAGAGGVYITQRISSVDYTEYTPPGEIVRFRSYKDNQVRLMFDPRSRLYHRYLLHRTRQYVNAGLAFGNFFDEEAKFDCTPLRYGVPPMWPLGGNTGNASVDSAANWGPGSWNNFTRPFPTMNACQAADSGAMYRENWAGRYADSSRIYGWISTNNPAGTVGMRPGYWAQWTDEWQHATVTYGGSLIGESLNNSMWPSKSNSTRAADRFPSARWPLMCYAMRDKAVHFTMAFVRVGGYDYLEGKSFDRSLMNAWAWFLLGVYPVVPDANGDTTVYSFHPTQNQNVDWQRDRNFGGGVIVSDSVALWSDVMGLYYGYPTLTRDSNSQTSRVTPALLDPAGQPYEIVRWGFTHPLHPTEYLTWIVARWAWGTNFDSTGGTDVAVTLPAAQGGRPWYRFQSRNQQVAWDGPYAGGSTIYIANAECQFFSSDISATTGGVIDTTIAIGNASGYEGDAVTFTVYVSRALADNLTFTVNTSDNGSAVAGTDYTAIAAQTYTITAGQTSTTITVNTTEDTDVEADETFRVTISAPNYGTINTGTATGVIINDDEPPPQTITNGGWIRIWE